MLNNAFGQDLGEPVYTQEFDQIDAECTRVILDAGTYIEQMRREAIANGDV